MEKKMEKKRGEICCNLVVSSVASLDLMVKQHTITLSGAVVSISTFA